MNYFLHIGYHKTGTTYLQNKVFNNLDRTFYLGKPWINIEIKDLLNKLVKTHDHNFQKSYLKKELTKIERDLSSEYDNILISSEGLHSGYDWYGRETKQMSSRLKSIFPNAKIIIGIRGQSSYLESFYNQYVREGGYMNFIEFINSDIAQYSIYPKLLYDKMIEDYYNKFGHDNVHVYLYEDFKHKKQVTINSLYRFLGEEYKDTKYSEEKANLSINKYTLKILQVFNLLFSKGRNLNKKYYNNMLYILLRISSFLIFSKDKFKMDDKNKNKIKKDFQNSNSKLFLLINKDIDEYRRYY